MAALGAEAVGGFDPPAALGTEAAGCGRSRAVPVRARLANGRLDVVIDLLRRAQPLDGRLHLRIQVVWRGGHRPVAVAVGVELLGQNGRLLDKLRPPGLI